MFTSHAVESEDSVSFELDSVIEKEEFYHRARSRTRKKKQQHIQKCTQSVECNMKKWNHSPNIPYVYLSGSKWNTRGSGGLVKSEKSFDRLINLSALIKFN